MNVVHIINSISKKSGGTSTYLINLLSTLVKRTNNTVVFYKDNDQYFLPSELNILDFKRSYREIIFIYKTLTDFLKQNKVDIFHINGVWDLILYLAFYISYKHNIPYVVSTHGMMEPWSLSQSKLKKSLVRGLITNKYLHDSVCIHATSESEAKSLRNLGFKNPIAVIPNGINLSQFPDHKRKINTKKKILFLSRIHKKKGLENLIEAWSLIDSKIKVNWCIEIYGNGKLNYLSKLENIIKKFSLNNSIKIKGPVYGNDKIKVFKSADFFVLPTFSENFGIVVAEALAFKLPVITTKGTPWRDLNRNGCGYCINIGVNPLKYSLEKMMLYSDKERFKMGEIGRSLVKNKYSMESVGKDFNDLYNWINGKNIKPDFVDSIDN